MAETSIGLAELIRQARRDLLLDSTDADALPLLSIEEASLESLGFAGTASGGSHRDRFA